MNEIFIPYNVPSLKNSKIKTSKGIFSSKTVQKYLRFLGIKSYSCSKKTVEVYKTIPLIFPVESLIKLVEGIEYPYFIGLHFVRSSKHLFDFINASQIILDLFTAFNIIEDDDMSKVMPIPYKKNELWFSYNKEQPGVYVTVFQDYSISINL